MDHTPCRDAHSAAAALSACAKSDARLAIQLRELTALRAKPLQLMVGPAEMWGRTLSQAELACRNARTLYQHLKTTESPSTADFVAFFAAVDFADAEVRRAVTRCGWLLEQQDLAEEYRDLLIDWMRGHPPRAAQIQHLVDRLLASATPVETWSLALEPVRAIDPVATVAPTTSNPSANVDAWVQQSLHAGRMAVCLMHQQPRLWADDHRDLIATALLADVGRLTVELVPTVAAGNRGSMASAGQRSLQRPQLRPTTAGLGSLFDRSTSTRRRAVPDRNSSAVPRLRESARLVENAAGFETLGYAPNREALHPAISASWLAGIVDAPVNWSTWVGQHHERLNGRGYPRRVVLRDQGAAIRGLSLVMRLHELVVDPAHAGPVGSAPPAADQRWEWAAKVLFCEASRGEFDAALAEFAVNRFLPGMWACWTAAPALVLMPLQLGRAGSASTTGQPQRTPQITTPTTSSTAPASASPVVPPAGPGGPQKWRKSA